MKILVVGAGAIGGYFGARLAADGRDVTFLVRPRRLAQLEKTGLNVKSGFGDVSIRPVLLTSEGLKQAYDLVILSCKSYDLDGCMRDIAPAMDERSRVLPLLNGMSHLEALSARFGAACVLGGLARISVTLDAAGVVHQFGEFNALAFGALSASGAERAAQVHAALQAPRMEAQLSAQIEHDMWEKWVFIAAAASATTLLRATVGDIVAAGASDIPMQLLAECAAVAAENGFTPGAASLDYFRSILTAAHSGFSASMFRDIQNGSRIESDQIVADLLARSTSPRPLLKVTLAHLRSYEARRIREQGAR